MKKMSYAFEKQYIESISLSKKNKELKLKLEIMSKDNELLKETNNNFKGEFEQSRDERKKLQ